MNSIESYNFALPDELIARHPPAERTQSRLMLVDCVSGQIEDSAFELLPESLRAGDLLVINDARVIAARFRGNLQGDSQRRVELMFLRLLPNGIVEALAKPLKRLRPGTRLALAGGLVAEVIGREEESCLIRPIFDDADAASAERGQGRRFLDWLDRHGEVPLPPYLGREAEPDDKMRYQTVYASRATAVAAPTAGLHFDEAMLERLRSQGINIARLNLEIGPGTFAPIRAENIEDHQMHRELFTLSVDLLERLDEALRAGQRIIAVGTTVVRALESAAIAESWHSKPQETELMIRPGFQRRIVDAMLTNFHLPKSTLIVMVGALAGHELIQRCYEHAIESRYRFFSYGDAMFLGLDPGAKRPLESPGLPGRR